MKAKTLSSDLSPERALYLKKRKQHSRLILFWQISFFLFFLLQWEISAQLGWIDSFILSSPSRICRTLWTVGKQDLFYHIGVTVGETLLGFLLGVILGTGAATLFWWLPTVSKIADPYLVVLNSLPKIALGPVIIIIAGAGPKAIILMALAISLVVTVLEMLHGFERTEPEHLRMAETFGATRRQLFFKIVFPYNISTLLSCLKINLGLSFVGVIAGEFLVSRAGLGYLIVYGGQVFRMDLVMASVFLLATIAALFYEGITLLQKALNHRGYGRHI